MRTLYRIVARFLGLFRRNQHDDELAREMNAHLDMVADDYIRRGLSPAEARRKAVIDSGGIEFAKEAVRDQATMPRVEALMRDVAFAWRSLRRSPGYALPVIISLALGIGLNTSVFTMMEDVLRRPLPYANEGELITVGKLYDTRSDREEASIDWNTFDQDFDAWSAGSRTLTAMAKFHSTRAVIATNAGPEYLQGAATSVNLLQVLGTHTERGRWFTEAELREPVVVLSHDLWTRQFGTDSGILGKTINVDNSPRRIVGVLSSNAALPVAAQYWIPCTSCKTQGQIVARPRAGVALSIIKADLEQLSPSIFNLRKNGRQSELVIVPLHEQLFGSARPALQLLTTAAALLFLISCANIANLSFARTLERRRELAVRVALGAGRQSLAMLVFSENLLLGIVGAAVGLAIAYASSGALVSLAPAELTNVRNVSVNAGSALFAFALAMLATMAVSIAPVLNVTNARTQPMIGQSVAGAGRGKRLSGVRHALVTTQLALTLLLMTGAGLLIRSIAALTRADRLGFAPNGVVIANINLLSKQYSDSIAHRVFSQLLVARLSALPGVQSVAVGPAPLLAKQGNLREGINGVLPYIDSSQSPPSRHSIWVKDIGVDYLTTFRIKLSNGRNFRWSDDATAPAVAMINSTAARLFFKNRDPIGLPLPTSYSRGKLPAPIVVGVIGDMLQGDLTLQANPEVFLPAVQRGFSGSVTLAIRTSAPVAATIVSVREVLRQLDPTLAATRLESMDSVISASLSTHTFLVWLLAGFATLALVLSVIGLYGVVSYLVNQRTAEIGVRMALGAQRVQVFGLVLGESAILVLAGISIGSIAAFALAQLLARFLYEVQPHDALTFTVGPIILSVVALVAAYIPAMRASRVNPAITLRAD